MEKHVCILFCIVLIMSVPVRVYASSASGTLTVASGSGAGVGALWDGNGPSTEKIAIGGTLALLHSLGATVKLTQEAITAGKTAYDFMRDKFAQWVGGTSAEDMDVSEREALKKRFKVITGGGGSSEDPDQQQNDGLNVGPDGKIYFSPGTITMLKKFIDWLESTDQLKEEQQSTDQATQNDGYGETIVGSSVEYHSGVYNGTLTSTIPCGLYKSNNWIAFVSDQPFKVNGTDATLRNYHYVYGSSFPSNITSVVPSNMLHLNMTFNDFWKHLNGHTVTEPEPTIPEDGIYKGDNYNPDVLNNPDNKTIAVDPELIPNTTTDQDQQISIPDYFQWIVDNANANAAESNDPLQVPVTDPVTLAPGNLDVPVNVQDPIDTPLPYEVVNPEDTPVNPVQDPEKLPEPDDTIKLLKVDLKGIFPFCIPWDIYNLLSKFVADPVTPSIDWDWGSILGFLGVHTVMHLDLHDYDGVAEILRTMETVVFCVGLAYATKKVFIK